MSTLDLFDGLFVTLKCPKCGYGMDVEFQSVRLQAITFCPCCKVTIQLVDADASVYRGQEDVESAIKDIRSEIKKLNKTFKIKM